MKTMNRENVFKDLIYLKEDIQDVEKDVVAKRIRNHKIANIFESLRRVLEHTVADAAEKYRYKISEKTGKKKNIYFPYGQNKHDFSSALGRSGLKKLSSDNPLLLQLIEYQQPYNCQSNWVVDLFHLTNGSKHEGHNEVTSERGFSVGGIYIDDTCTNVVLSGNRHNGISLPNVHIKDRENYTVSGPNPHLFRVINSNVMQFEGKNVEIIPFMNHCFERVKTFVNNFYSKL